MDYQKYSKQKFEEAGLNSSIARKLADQLEADVTKEIHDVVFPKFREIIEGLNSVGYNLEPYGPIEVDDISFRDEPESFNNA